jgi:hypothetical protein
MADECEADEFGERAKFAIVANGRQRSQARERIAAVIHVSSFRFVSRAQGLPVRLRINP